MSTQIDAERIVGEHTIDGHRVRIQVTTWADADGRSYDILSGVTGEVLTEESFDSYPTDDQIRATLAEHARFLGEEEVMPRPTAPRFQLDEAKARAFLHRALRRYDGTLADGEGVGIGRDETWTLEPGWNTENLVSDELGHVEDLVHQALHVAGVITLTDDLPIGPDGMDIELLIEAAQDGDWHYYQWRVNLPIGSQFALCGPYREEIRCLGWTDHDIQAKGCRSAMGILREAVNTGNQILAGYTEANGRVLAGIARPA